MPLPKNAPLDIKAVAKDLRAGDRTALARAITMIEAGVRTIGRSPRSGAEAAARTPARPSAWASPACPGVGKSHLHRPARHQPHRRRPPGRGARRRPLQHPHRRLDPRRQDPHGAAGGRPRRLHPPLAGGRHARRRGPGDPRDDPGVRGGRLRRGPGRDGRRRPVRDRRGRHGRLLPGAHAAPAPATSCRASRRACSSSPTWSRSTRPTATTHAGRAGRGGVPPGAAPDDARPPATWSPPVLDLFGPDRHRPGRAVGARSSCTAASWPRPASSSSGAATSRCAGCGRCWSSG